MATIIRDSNLKRMPGSIKPDSKKRVVLPDSLVGEDIIFHVYSNDLGQIVLDPQVTIPASELWLFENKEALDSVDKGMAESLNGQATKRGSFGKYVKNAA
jgi:CRISPR/Cas system-associated protein Csm6